MRRQQFDYLIKELREKLGDNRIKIDEPLSSYTTFRLGGPAKIYFQSNNPDELVFAVRKASQFKIPYFILGGGSNLLVSDKGFNGLVIKNNTNKIRIKRYEGFFAKGRTRKSKIQLEVLSGVAVNQLVRFTLDNGLSGLEAFLGQPGTIGGAIYINAHNIAMGEFFGDKIKTAKILTKEGEIKEVPRYYFKFGYDESILQKTKEIVLSVDFELEKEDKRKVWDKANQAMEYRRHTQPLGKGSAGCIFRNISKSESLRIGLPNGTTSAGYLIEAAGLKGIKIGKAQIALEHANFIVNCGGARTDEVITLIKIVKEKVREKFGINLKEEIVYLGEEKF